MSSLDGPYRSTANDNCRTVSVMTRTVPRELAEMSTQQPTSYGPTMVQYQTPCNVCGQNHNCGPPYCAYPPNLAAYGQQQQPIGTVPSILGRNHASENIRELPTRDCSCCAGTICKCHNLAARYGLDSSVPYKMSSAAPKRSQRPTSIFECTPKCPNTLSNSIPDKDAVWTIKITKDVGSMTQPMDTAMTTQTSETRIITASELEDLLESTGRHTDDDQDEYADDQGDCRDVDDEEDIITLKYASGVNEGLKMDGRQVIECQCQRPSTQKWRSERDDSSIYSTDDEVSMRSTQSAASLSQGDSRPGKGSVNIPCMAPCCPGRSASETPVAIRPNLRSSAGLINDGKKRASWADPHVSICKQSISSGRQSAQGTTSTRRSSDRSSRICRTQPESQKTPAEKKTSCCPKKQDPCKIAECAIKPEPKIRASESKTKTSDFKTKTSDSKKKKSSGKCCAGKKQSPSKMTHPPPPRSRSGSKSVVCICECSACGTQATPSRHSIITQTRRYDSSSELGSSCDEEKCPIHPRKKKAARERLKKLAKEKDCSCEKRKKCVIM